MPVLNGATTGLRRSLDGIIGQTHRELDIVISDNASEDETEAICREYAKRDPRIRYYRQPRRVTAAENFRFALERTTAPWFMWAAHDDNRSLNYVEVLLRGAESFPNASLLFSDVCFVHAIERPDEDTVVLPELTEPDRLRRHVELSVAQYYKSACVQVYGLVSRKALASYAWRADVVGADVPLLHHLGALGDFKYLPGATLFFSVENGTSGAHMKSIAAHWCRDLDRHLWCAAQAAAIAYGGGLSLRTELFLGVGLAVHGNAVEWARAVIYDRVPVGSRVGLRRVKDAVKGIMELVRG